MDLHEELARLVDALADCEVEYALCGGLALAVHGFPRFTKDIDLLVRKEDVEGIVEAARDRGFVVIPAGVIRQVPSLTSTVTVSPVPNVVVV